MLFKMIENITEWIVFIVWKYKLTIYIIRYIQLRILWPYDYIFHPGFQIVVELNSFDQIP